MKAFLFLVTFFVVYATVKSTSTLKCFQCDDCKNERAVMKSCELKSEDRCLKFVGIDKAINDHKKTVKKRCSSEMGCDYFFNVQNYTVHGCQLCSAQLCNEGSRLDLSHAFFLFTIILFLLISN